MPDDELIVAFSTQAEESALDPTWRERHSGYQNSSSAIKRLMKVRELVELVGGDTIDFDPTSKQLFTYFHGSRRDVEMGLAAALLSQNGFPARRPIQVAVVTPADVLMEHKHDRSPYAVNMARDLIRMALPGQIVTTMPSVELYMEILQELPTLSKRLVLVNEKSSLFDMSRVIDSRYICPVAQKLELMLQGGSTKLSTRQLDAAIGKSGPFENTLTELLSVKLNPDRVNLSSLENTIVRSSGRRPTPGSGSSKHATRKNHSGEPGKRYLRAQFPRQVCYGCEYQLVVQVVIKGRKNDAPLKSINIPSKGIDIDLILIAAGFVYKSKKAVTCHVPAKNDSEPVRFDVKVKSKNPGPLKVSAYYRGANLGQVVVQTQITETSPSEEVDEHKAQMGGGRDVGEKTLTMQIDWDEQGNKYRIVLARNRGELYISKPATLRHTRWNIAQALVNGFGDLARGTEGYSPDAAAAKLRGLGFTLWDHLLPKVIQERLIELSNGIDELLILSDGDPMPWEVLRPRTGNDTHFLTESFQVTRMLLDYRDDAPSFTMKSAKFVVPYNSPPGAENEAKKIEELLTKKGVECKRIQTLDELLEAFESAKFDLMHFACHNDFRFETESLEAASIAMEGGAFTPILLAEHKGRFSRQPLVFLNACTSGQAAPQLTGMSGWATAFRAAGAGGFVGTLWEVRDQSSTQFAIAWYDALVNGKTVAEAFKGGRAKVDTTDPTRLAFTAYIDPKAQLKFT